MNEIKPGFDVMLPVKAQSNDYDEYEKTIIVAKASVAGLKQIVELYGLKWQTVRNWKSRLLGTKSAATATTASVNTKLTENAEAAVIIQSPDGHEITVDEIISKIGGVTDKIYICVDKNVAYWVKGEENSSVNLW